MRIEVTPRCSGHGRCYSLAPSVFQADDEGYNVAIGQIIDVPADASAEAHVGVTNCPESALVIITDRGT